MNTIKNKSKVVVKGELALRGGTLFKFAADMEKAFPNVSLDPNGNFGNLEKALQEQNSSWESYWNPKMTILKRTLFLNLNCFVAC